VAEAKTVSGLKLCDAGRETRRGGLHAADVVFKGRYRQIVAPNSMAFRSSDLILNRCVWRFLDEHASAAPIAASYFRLGNTSVYVPTIPSSIPPADCCVLAR